MSETKVVRISKSVYERAMSVKERLESDGSEIGVFASGSGDGGFIGYLIARGIQELEKAGEIDE